MYFVDITIRCNCKNVTAFDSTNNINLKLLEKKIAASHNIFRIDGAFDCLQNFY